jgi:hypothetical protein
MAPPRPDNEQNEEQANDGNEKHCRTLLVKDAQHRMTHLRDNPANKQEADVLFQRHVKRPNQSKLSQPESFRELSSSIG